MYNDKQKPCQTCKRMKQNKLNGDLSSRRALAECEIMDSSYKDSIQTNYRNIILKLKKVTAFETQEVRVVPAKNLGCRSELTYRL